jgi:lysozyme family protein
LPPSIAAKVFDAAVNIGIDEAVRALQRALRAARAIRIEEDGRLGPATLAAVRATAADAVLPALREALAGHYRLIVAGNPAQARFLNGWLARAYS